MRSRLIAVAFGAALAAQICSAASTPIGRYEAVVQAFLFVDQSHFEGKLWVAGRYASAKESESAAASLQGFSEAEIESVRDILARDFAEHQSEYLLRERLSFRSVSTGRAQSEKADAADYQRALHAAFLDDPRYACRIARALAREGLVDRVSPRCEGVEPGRVDPERVARVLSAINAHMSGGGETGCAAHPTLFVHRLPEEDPLLLAVVYELYFTAAENRSAPRLVELLRARGWTVEPADSRE